MGDFDGETRYAEYDSFSVGSTADKYELHVGLYSGDAGMYYPVIMYMYMLTLRWGLACLDIKCMGSFASIRSKIHITGPEFYYLNNIVQQPSSSIGKIYFR